MSDNLNPGDEARIGSVVKRAYSNEVIDTEERRRHRARMADARGRSESRGTSMLRPGRMELVVVGTMLVLALAIVAVWQSLPGMTPGEPGTPTLPLGAGAPDGTTLEPVVRIEQMRILARAPAPGEGYTYTVRFTSDVRLDQSAELIWEAEIWERTLEDGTRQQRVTIYNQALDVLVDYVRNGDAWYWDNRGWVESGEMENALHLPPEVAMSLAEPARIIELLGDEVGGRPIDGDATIVNQMIFQFDPQAVPGLDAIASTHGMADYQYVTEMLFDATPNNGRGDSILSSEWLLIENGARADEAPRLSLGRFTFLTEPQMGAEYFSDDHFILPGVAVQRFDGPDPETLPFGLEVIDRYQITPEGGERLLLANDEMQLEFLVLPSLGGVDMNTWFALTAAGHPGIGKYSSASSGAGEISWLEQDESGPIVAAIWDDGSYLFRTIALPLNWTDRELVELAVALSPQ